MAEVTEIAKELRKSIKLTQPELLADVPDGYNARQVFNFLRHKATNYEALLEQHQQRYGNVTPAENKALTQGAADVVIEVLRTENDELIRGEANTRFAQFVKKLRKSLELELRKLLGLTADIDLGIYDVDLQAIYKATLSLKKSQRMFKSWNERYRRQRELILKVTKSIDPEIRHKIEDIYSANSNDKLEQLEKALFDG